MNHSSQVYYFQLLTFSLSYVDINVQRFGPRRSRLSNEYKIQYEKASF
jgi:hypothetical protein